MVDSTTPFCTALETVRNDAVESTICRRNGSQIARLNWRLHGVRDACGSQAAAAANGRFERIFV
eukprot:1055856-Lingulodinium_polyedra.AAC.1